MKIRMFNSSVLLDQHHNIKLRAIFGRCTFLDAVGAFSCVKGIFAVIFHARLEAEHDDRGSFGEVSWVKNLKLHIDRIEVDLLQKSKVQVSVN